MPNSISTTLSRRTRVAASLASGAALVSHPHVSAQNATPADAGWSYTDVLGRTITLPSAPTSIAAQIGTAASLWDFGVEVSTVFGWTAANYPDGDHVAWGSIDVSKVEMVSNVDASFNLEALILQEPEIIVTWCWDRELGLEALADVDSSILDQLQEIAPIMVIRQGDDNEVELGLHEAFAAALGADIESVDLEEARETYASRVAEVSAIAQARSEISVLFGSFGEAEGFYVAGPDYVSDLGQLRSLGVNIANDGSPTSTSYWEMLSYEQALLYPSDVIFVDQYGSAKTLEDLRELTTINMHPAVEAGQVGPWKRDLPISYQGLTEFLDSVLDQLRVAEKVS